MRGGGAVPTYLDVDEEITTIQYPGGARKLGWVLVKQQGALMGGFLLDAR